MTRLTLLRASDYRRVRWKNDGGWTTEIAREPADASDDFRWRISIADIESDGPFSTFPGVVRDLLLLSGNGIELDIDDASPLRLTERFQRVRFGGDARVECRLVAGPTRDFNVMARQDTVRADVMARPLVGSMVLFAEADVVWLAHVFSGHAEARAGRRAHFLRNRRYLAHRLCVARCRPRRHRGRGRGRAGQARAGHRRRRRESRLAQSWIPDGRRLPSRRITGAAREALPCRTHCATQPIGSSRGARSVRASASFHHKCELLTIVLAALSSCRREPWLRMAVAL